jgi:hypothetical protein
MLTTLHARLIKVLLNSVAEVDLEAVCVCAVAMVEVVAMVVVVVVEEEEEEEEVEERERITNDLQKSHCVICFIDDGNIEASSSETAGKHTSNERISSDLMSHIQTDMRRLSRLQG